VKNAILTALLIVLLAACAIQPGRQSAEPEAKPALPDSSQANESVGGQPSQQAASEKAQPADEGFYERMPEPEPTIQSFLQHFRDKVKNYKFTYNGDEWTVAGNNARIDLRRPIMGQYHAPLIDTIYLDLERKTATGLCEGRKDQNIKKKCLNQNVLRRRYAVPFIQFKIKLPEEWLYEFRDSNAKTAETPKLFTDRKTVHLKHLAGTSITDFYIDPSIGLPIVVVDNGMQYAYEKLSKNSILPGEKAMLD
jgi:hypothetical protein